MFRYFILINRKVILFKSLDLFESMQIVTWHSNPFFKQDFEFQVTIGNYPNDHDTWVNQNDVSFDRNWNTTNWGLFWAADTSGNLLVSILIFMTILFLDLEWGQYNCLFSLLVRGKLSQYLPILLGIVGLTHGQFKLKDPSMTERNHCEVGVMVWLWLIYKIEFTVVQMVFSNNGALL